MSTTIILGDVHLEKSVSIGKTSVGNGLNSRIIDQVNLLDWTLEQAIEHSAKRIVLTGDVFEHPKPHPTVIKIFISWLKKCQAHSVDVHIIFGNHDMLRTGQFSSSVLDVVSEAEIDGVYIYSDINTVFFENVGVTLLPFRDRRSFNVDKNETAISLLKDKLVFELSSIPDTYKKVLIGHLAIEGSIYVGDEIDDASNELFCSPAMFEGYDYVWMGHVHKPQVLSTIPYVAHVGSMDRSDMGESDHKKIIIVFDPELPEDFKHVEIPTRPLKKISIEVPADTEDTTAFVIEQIKEIKEDVKNGIVKIDLQLLGQDAKNVDRKAVERELANLGVYHVSNFVESKKINLLKKKDDKIDHVVTESFAIREWASKFVDEKIRDKFVALAEEIKSELSAQGK